jgi:hypothetical protein
LNDSLSYDITGWALPLAYGVEGYVLKVVRLKTKIVIENKEKNIPQNALILCPIKNCSGFINVNKTSKYGQVKKGFGDIERVVC